MNFYRVSGGAAVVIMLACSQGVSAQATKAPAKGAPAATTAAAPVAPPPGYVIGPEDVLSIFFWRSKDLSGDVVVRPDGKISLPLLNDIQAATLTPDELRVKLIESATRYLEDPTATVIVKQINSRKVFITGQISKPGAYPLMGPMTVMQVIALAGGLTEYAKEQDISIMRTKDGKPVSYPFNYKDVSKRKNLAQNIELVAGDVITIP